MKSAILIGLVVIVIVGAILVGTKDHANSNIVNRKGYGTVCLNGVTYYRADRALAPAFNLDGSLIGCDE